MAHIKFLHKIRETPSNRALKVMLGGYEFQITKEILSTDIQVNNENYIRLTGSIYWLCPKVLERLEHIELLYRFSENDNIVLYDATNSPNVSTDLDCYDKTKEITIIAYEIEKYIEEIEVMGIKNISIYDLNNDTILDVTNYIASKDQIALAELNEIYCSKDKDRLLRLDRLISAKKEHVKAKLSSLQYEHNELADLLREEKDVINRLNKPKSKIEISHNGYEKVSIHSTPSKLEIRSKTREVQIRWMDKVFDIGEFLVKLIYSKENMSFILKIENLTKRKDRFHHPHICEEIICLGGFADEINRALANLEIQRALSLVLAYLHKYDHASRYTEIIKWET